MYNKKLVLVTGNLFVVLGSILPLLGLSYVLYWGTVPEPLGAQGFPYYSFWLGTILLIVGVASLAVSAIKARE